MGGAYIRTSQPPKKGVLLSYTPSTTYPRHTPSLYLLLSLHTSISYRSGSDPSWSNRQGVETYFANRRFIDLASYGGCRASGVIGVKGKKGARGTRC